ncbi:MAG: metallophosphoesterase [Pseudomonadota bacterium]
MKKYMAWMSIMAGLVLLISGCSNSGGSGISLKAGDTVSFTLIQTTDVHHRALGTGPSATYGTAADQTRGGYSRIATAIKAIRAEKDAMKIPSLLVDSGDFLMGTVYDFSLGEVAVALEFINLMKYDAITFGNHEFDYGPRPLALFLTAARGSDGSGFDVPVVASNMVTSPDQAGDNGIEALQDAGIIRDYRLITLSNGLKVGIIGLMGKNAESDAPLASPITFRNDMANPGDVAFLQELVDHLKNDLGAHVVIALSHSGVMDPDTAPHGDDIDLANAVTGIDIIAAGHEHVQTDSLISQNGARIFCAGRYGENLAQLDVTVTIGQGVTAATLDNHPITPMLARDSSVEFLMGVVDAGINASLDANGLPAINDVVAGTDSGNLAKPSGARETGMGNLVADALRNTLGGFTQAVGVVPNGVIRDGFQLGQGISFADLYSVLPLGMTLDTTQQNVPGYPLMLVYLTGQELANMCQFIAYTMAADDSAFAASLPVRQAAFSQAAQDAAGLASALNSGSPNDLGAYAAFVLPQAGSSPADQAIAAFNAAGTGDSAACQAAAQIYTAAAAQATRAAALCQGLPMVLPSLGNDYFMNTSGLRFTHGGANGLYQVSGVSLYAAGDLTCSGGVTPVNTGTLYPLVIDLYALLVMEDQSVQTMLTALGIPIVIKDATGTALNSTTLMTARLDRDNNPANGIQEVKEWVAFLMFLTGGQFPGNVIPDADYGTTTLGRIN